jgi:hypothetical protein
MINLINSIADRDFVSADSILEETVELIMARKLEEAKKMTASKMCEQGHVMNRTAAELTRLGVVEEEEEAGEESSMARSELNAITKDAKSIMSKVKGNKELEAWTQSKITKAADYLNSVADYMSEEEKDQLDEARIKIIKARIRGGKIQRRKKVSNVPGMTLRSGKLQRMSPAERRRRKMGARRAKIKRRSGMNRALMKRQRSLRKRKALGI